MSDSAAKPAISVIIPTYNRAKILKKALAAYQTQTIHQDQFEIIVVDDGSTDDTDKTVPSLAADQPNIRYFRQEHGGPARARNLGIEKARSALILFTGDDCIPHKYLLQEHLRMHKKGEAIAVLGHIDWHPDLEITPFMRYISIDTQFSYPKISQTAENVPFGYFYTSNISIPLKYLKSVGSFDPDFADAVFEDVELGYRVWKSGVRIVYNRRAVAYHHHNLEIKDYISRQIKLGKAASLLYKKHPELVDLLRIPKIASAEVRVRFYQGVLDYYYFVGLQEGLQTDKGPKNFIPLQDRLKNWSDIDQFNLSKTLIILEEQYRNAHRIISARDKQIKEFHIQTIPQKDIEIAKRDSEIVKRDSEIVKRDSEIAKRDKLIEELHTKNMEKHYRIVELEKLELRLHSSFLYKAYRSLRKLLLGC